MQEESRKEEYSYDRKRYIGDMANWVGDCHMTPSIACLYLLLGVGSARCCVSLKKKGRMGLAIPAMASFFTQGHMYVLLDWDFLRRIDGPLRLREWLPVEI